MFEQDEQMLLKELSAGNIRAFEYLFITHQPKLVSFISKFVGDEEVSKDLAQDIFYDIWKTREKFSDVSCFSAYLFTMAKNKIYNYFDHQTVCNQYKQNISYSTERASTFEGTINSRDLYNIIISASSKLTPRRRQIFLMSRFQGLSNEDISKALGIDKRTVENHISSALSVMRDLINKLLVLCVCIGITHLF